LKAVCSGGNVSRVIGKETNNNTAPQRASKKKINASLVYAGSKSIGRATKPKKEGSAKRV
jgi:hypothetical protein